MSSVRIKHTKSKIDVKLKEKASKFAIHTKKDDISLPAVVVFSGARGSGKTYACIMFVRHLEKKKYITRTFLLCPTRHSNDLYSNLKTLKDKDSFEDENHFNVALHHILSAVRKDWEEYDQAQEYAKVFYKAQRNPMNLTLQEQMVLEYNQGNPPVRVRKPAHMLIVDDAQGTSLYNNSRQDLLTHIVIKHQTHSHFHLYAWLNRGRVYPELYD
jgi:type I site-specific restriction endonuclease